MNESFQKLNDTFNMDGADVDLDEDIKQSENEGDDSYLKKQKYKLNSHDYLIMELQDQIERIRTVAEEMRQCCKVGAPPRMFEVYANMEEKISNNIMKIKELEETETDYQVTETKEKMAAKNLELRQQSALMRLQKNANPNQVIQNQTNNQYNTYTMTSNELLEKTLEATNNEQNVITDIKDLPHFDLD
jgi:hypothetical protein